MTEYAICLLDGLDDELPTSHRLPAVRAELMVRAGRADRAAVAFDLAIARCDNEVEREHLSCRRQEALG
jgi:RNA polymerase sigma-70 factor (ECF subfamily)